MASSTELSTTSHTRWWRPVGPVEPMYIPGRFRTGSRPSRTVILLASYVGFPTVRTFSGFSATGAPFRSVLAGGNRFSDEFPAERHALPAPRIAPDSNAPV